MVLLRFMVDQRQILFWLSSRNKRSYSVSFDSQILDIGLVDDIPSSIMNSFDHTEIGLREAWDILGVGERIHCMCFKGAFSKPCILTYDQALEAIKKYDTITWIPHDFSNSHNSRIIDLYHYRTLTLDLDSKVDPMFWTKTRDMIRSWGLTGVYMGIPAPKMILFSGNGLHLYWFLNKRYDNARFTDVVKVILRFFQLKISSFYESHIDFVHIVQSYRLPSSKTKDGEICKSFIIDNAKSEYDIFELASFLIDKKHHSRLLDYLDGTGTLDDIFSILDPLAEAIGIKVKDTEDKIAARKEYRKPDSTVVDAFDGRGLGRISDLIDNNPVAVNKQWAKKCVYVLKTKSPIPCGKRNNMLFTLAVCLAKCGFDKESIADIVDIANQWYCEVPMHPWEVANCYAKPHDFTFMRESTIKERFEIYYWPSYNRKPSVMTRTEAALKASKTSNESAIQKLKQAYLDLGVNVKVRPLCKHAGISAQTYYRYKRNGTIDSILQQIKQETPDKI